MRKGWTEVALGEVVTHRSQFIEIDDLKEYQRCRVRLHAQGVELRDKLPGALIKTKSQQVCRADEFLVAEIDAKMGGYGLVPAALEGAVVSSHYFLFEVKKEVMTPRYLSYFARTRFFADQVKARGSTNYSSVRPGNILGYKIALPPLAEQQRIVAHLDAIESRLTRAQKLREESALESLALIRSMMQPEHCQCVQSVPMHELVTWRSPDVSVSQSESYPFAGVYCFGRGVFKKESVSGMDFAYDRLTRLRAGEFTFPKLMAWEGALGIVPPECDGCHVSPEFPVFTVDESKVLPEILDIHFKTPAVWKDLAAISTGTNLRRRRLNPNAFLGYEFPLPPMKVQQQVKAIAERATAKRKLQSEATVMEKALFPSLLDRLFNA
jgi:type I restriction enzyme S subunit